MNKPFQITKVNLHKILWGFFLLYSTSLFSQDQILVKGGETYRHCKTFQHTLSDIQHHFNKAFAKNLRLHIELPENVDTNFCFKTYHYQNDIHKISYPSTAFQLTVQNPDANQINISISATHIIGVQHALYAFFQDHLNILFIHPRQTIYPEKTPNITPITFSDSTRFNIIGFHQHTQHPIELTEYLLDRKKEGNLQEVKKYIDWLAQNKQNYFEFSLLENLHLRKWPLYAKKIVEYAHQRGVLVGVDLSLRMLQQKAFKLYRLPPTSFRSKEKQIARRLKKLAVADFDVYNIEFSATEFSEGNATKKEKLMVFTTQYIDSILAAKAMNRKHVVKHEHMIHFKDNHALNYFDPVSKKIDEKRGSMVHTVMSYALKDKYGPAYNNKNMIHMYKRLLIDKKVRETWYYPESAYWITFDNSIPNFFTGYISARNRDIQTCDSLNIDGHITFTSGIEWNHWLFDWNIARLSSSSLHKSTNNNTASIDYLFNSEKINQAFLAIDKLQSEYLLEKQLIRYITANQPSDEVKGKLSFEFQPRPKKQYKYLFRKATQKELTELKEKVIKPLKEYVSLLETQIKSIENTQVEESKEKLLKELVLSLKVTALRAQHKSQSLNYIAERRIAKINQASFDKKAQSTPMIETRSKALELVKEQERNYRYDYKLLSGKFKGKTAYRFGYLYPVSNLHFWKREEDQLLHNRFSPFYRNIWDIARIIGLIN